MRLTTGLTKCFITGLAYELAALARVEWTLKAASRGAGKARRRAPEVREQSARGHGRDAEDRGKHDGFGRPIAANQGQPRDHRGEHDENHADTAMEAPGLGVWPRVERLGDLTPVVGVGALALCRAGVANGWAGAVVGEAPAMVGVYPA